MRSTKIIKICSSSLCTCLHHMVILRTRNKITDFLMILAWASPFKCQVSVNVSILYKQSWNICSYLQYWNRFFGDIYIRPLTPKEKYQAFIQSPFLSKNKLKTFWMSHQNTLDGSYNYTWSCQRPKNVISRMPNKINESHIYLNSKTNYM